MKIILHKLKQICKLIAVSGILSFFGAILITILAIFIRRKKKTKKFKRIK